MIFTRALFGTVLLALLAANTALGVEKILLFADRYRGEKALARADLDVAYERLESALARRPGDAPSLLMLARVIQLSQSNRVPIEPLEGHSPEEVLRLGIEALAGAISKNPADAWAWFNLAEVLDGYQAGRLRIDRLRAAVEAAQAGGDPVAAVKNAAHAGPQPEDAVIIASARKARHLAPESCFYLDYLAKIYLDRGYMEEATPEIRESFALWPVRGLHPWMEDINFIRALAEPILEGIGEGLSNPLIEPIDVAWARADLLESLGRGPEAIAALQEVRELGGEEVRNECDLRAARLLQMEGKYEESLPLLLRIQETDPQGGSAGSAHLYLARAYTRRGDHEGAVKSFRQFLSRKPGSLSTLLEFASELEKTSRDVEAERVYTAMVERFPEEPTAHENLIDFLTRRRRFADALSRATEFAQSGADDGLAAALIRQIQSESARRGP